MAKNSGEARLKTPKQQRQDWPKFANLRQRSSNIRVSIF